MGEVTYSVWLGDQLLADRMSIDSALIFVKALFENHWQEFDAYTIRKNDDNVIGVIGGDEQ